MAKFFIDRPVFAWVIAIIIMRNFTVSVELPSLFAWDLAMRPPLFFGAGLCASVMRERSP